MLRVLWAAVIADSQSQYRAAPLSCILRRWVCTAQGVQAGNESGPTHATVFGASVRPLGMG